MIPRALFRSIRISTPSDPNASAHLKIYYPAQLTGSDAERSFGVVAPWGDAPFPVVMLAPPVNLAPESMSWLARRLVQSGMLVVTYAVIAEEMPGYMNLTPGIDLSALDPSVYGRRPSGLALRPVLDELRRLNETGLLKDRIDVSRIALGGHSAGGSVALMNANPDWLPGLRAVFSYGAHTGVATALGAGASAVMAICEAVPVLLLGGSLDGCIAQSASRYGEADGDATGRVIRTFEEAITRKKGDCGLVILEGANHFTFANPNDETTGRSFLDPPETLDGAASRTFMGDMIAEFVTQSFAPEFDGSALRAMSKHEFAGMARWK